MKKTVVKVLSIILALACLHGVAMSAFSFSDISSVKEKWEKMGQEQTATLDSLSESIKLYKANTEAAEKAEQEAAEKAEQEGTDGEGTDKAETQPAQNAPSASDSTSEANVEQAPDTKDANVKAYWDAYNKTCDEADEAQAKFNDADAALKADKQELNDSKAALDAAKAEKAAADAAVASKEAGYQAAQTEYNTVSPTYNLAIKKYNEYQTSKSLYESLPDGALKDSAKNKMDNNKRALDLLTGGQDMESIIARYNASQATITDYENAQSKASTAQSNLDSAQSRYNAAAQTDSQNQAAYDAAKAELEQAISKKNTAYRRYQKAKNESQNKDDTQPQEPAKDENPDKLTEEIANIDLKDGAQDQISSALDIVLDSPAYTNAAGEQMLPGIQERLGESFSYWTVNDKGEAVIDPEKAMLAVDTAKEYMAECIEAAAKELKSINTATIIQLAVCVVGLIAALLGLFGKIKISAIAAALTAIAAVFGIVNMGGISGHEYPFTAAAGSSAGEAVFTALVIMLVAAAVYDVPAWFSVFKPTAEAAKNETVE